MTGPDPALHADTQAVDRGGRVLLGLAAVAVGFAAADNYVVVLALPDMMGSAGLSAEDLQQAAPIISGFLLGYIAILPLIGRIADVRGRLPVLVGSLVVFGLGSVITAAAYDLPSVVVGRLVQGVGAGGLLPATLALVADIYPPRRRGLPLGVVGAVQELGNVAGPVYGAVVLAFAGWRTIFWINLAVALVLAAVIRLRRREYAAAGPTTRRFDLAGAMLALAALAGAVLVMIQPRPVLDHVTWGLALLPVVGEGRWLSPVALAVMVLLVLLVVRCLVASNPLLDIRSWGRTLARVDLPGSLILAVALAGVILAFATAEPEAQLLAPSGVWLLVLSCVAALLFWRRNRRASHPLVPRGAVAARPAWGALVVSFFVGAAVIAALVDVPIFARLTIYNDSQLMAALVLVRFLVGLPVGAFVGGWLTRHLDAGVVTALGMVVSAAGFVWMSRWPFEALENAWSNVPLVAAGLGVGLAMAPVNAALLASTSSPVHGLASALLIVARTVGKLVGISVLTTIGLHRYYAAQEGLPEPMEVCGAGDSRCAEFSRLLQDAALTQLHTTFLGAAVSCLLAGGLALVVLRGADTREVRTSAFQAGVG
ncbi:MFS transporter [Nocardioides dilutus]